jgi:hypothetical protein
VFIKIIHRTISLELSINNSVFQGLIRLTRQSVVLSYESIISLIDLKNQTCVNGNTINSNDSKNQSLNLPVPIILSRIDYNQLISLLKLNYRTIFSIQITDLIIADLTGFENLSGLVRTQNSDG